MTSAGCQVRYTTRDHQVDGHGLACAFAQRFDSQAHILAAPWLVAERQPRAVLELACQVVIALVGIAEADFSTSGLARAGYLTEDRASGLQAIGALGDV